MHNIFWRYFNSTRDTMSSDVFAGATEQRACMHADSVLSAGIHFRRGRRLRRLTRGPWKCTRTRRPSELGRPLAAVHDALHAREPAVRPSDSPLGHHAAAHGVSQQRHQLVAPSACTHGWICTHGPCGPTASAQDGRVGRHAAVFLGAAAPRVRAEC